MGRVRGERRGDISEETGLPMGRISSIYLCYIIQHHLSCICNMLLPLCHCRRCWLGSAGLLRCWGCCRELTRERDGATLEVEFVCPAASHHGCHVERATLCRARVLVGPGGSRTAVEHTLGLALLPERRAKQNVNFTFCRTKLCRSSLLPAFRRCGCSATPTFCKRTESVARRTHNVGLAQPRRATSLRHAMMRASERRATSGGELFDRCLPRW